MFKRVMFLLGLGVFMISTMAQASIFERQEYSNIEKYLKPDQQQAFEKVIGGNLNKIKNNGYILEKLEIDKEKNAESIAIIQKEIEELKIENEREIAKLEKDFIRNPQRYNLETIYSFTKETK